MGKTKRKNQSNDNKINKKSQVLSLSPIVFFLEELPFEGKRPSKAKNQELFR
jgi:hypothetical protein